MLFNSGGNKTLILIELNVSTITLPRKYGKIKYSGRSRFVQSIHLFHVVRVKLKIENVDVLSQSFRVCAFGNSCDASLYNVPQ